MGKRDEVRRENKDINRPVLFNRINFMAVYLIGIYLPYILYLSVKFDIAEISLPYRLADGRVSFCWFTVD